MALLVTLSSSVVWFEKASASVLEFYFAEISSALIISRKASARSLH
jgi:hypothetical protein